MRGILAEDFPAIRYKVDRLFLGPPVGWPVQMRVVGPDREEVRRIADKVTDAFRAEPLLSAVHDDWLEPVPTMKLVIDQDRARAFGVSSERIRQVLQASLSGAPIGDFREGEETISIVLRQPDAERTLLSAVESTYVPTDLGGAVPVSQLAHVVPALEPGIEWRRDRLPTITVRGTVPDDVQPNDVAMALYAKLQPLRDQLPPGYSIAIQGGAEDAAESQASIAAKAPIMLFVIMVLLMVQLRHFGKALLVFFTGPLGLIGAAAALLDNATLRSGSSPSSGSLRSSASSCATRSSSSIRSTRIAASGIDPFEAVVGAAVRRFRPIMLTAAAAVLALIPIAQSLFWGPLAYAMMGGIMVATVLTVLVLPAAYALFFRVGRGVPSMAPMAASSGQLALPLEADHVARAA